jgi:hypothetical protein
MLRSITIPVNFNKRIIDEDLKYEVKGKAILDSEILTFATPFGAAPGIRYSASSPFFYIWSRSSMDRIEVS